MAEMQTAGKPEPASWALPRVLLIILGLGGALAVLAGLQSMRDLLAPMFLALNLAIAVSPLQMALVRIKVPRPIAALIAGALVLAFLAVFSFALGWSLTVLITELPQYRDRFFGLYESGIDLLSRLGVSEDQLTQQAKAIDPQSIVGVLSDVLSNVRGVVSILLIVITMIFFLMMDSMSFDRRLRKAGFYHPQLTNALTAFGEGVRRYWVVTTVFGLIVAVLDVIALGIIGVPLALVWGVLSFLTNYIPNIGFVIGLIPPALMALLAQGPTAAIAVVVVYSVLNFVVQTIVQPKFAGDAVGVTPTVTFVSLLLWSWVLGALGALLALPCTLLVKAVLIDADPRARWANALVASRMESADAHTTEAAHRPEATDEDASPTHPQGEESEAASQDG